MTLTVEYHRGVVSLLDPAETTSREELSDGNERKNQISNPANFLQPFCSFCPSPDSLAIDHRFHLPYHLSIQFFNPSVPTLPRHPYHLSTPRFPSTLQSYNSPPHPIVVDRMAGAGGSCISAGVNDALQACCVFVAEDVR